MTKQIPSQKCPEEIKKPVYIDKRINPSRRYNAYKYIYAPNIGAPNFIK
jgi:hypothetical protein